MTPLTPIRSLPALPHPAIMGILNVTPDSFSDGGLYLTPDKALKKVELLLNEGADIIDIGGESSRPGATAISVQEELDRIMPVIEQLRKNYGNDLLLSIDTHKPAAMTEAIRMGVNFINDINALCDTGALDAITPFPVYVCLMHKQGNSKTMQENPHYNCVTQDVKNFLKSRIDCCLAKGIEHDRIIIDPGFGFGKTTTHNLQLLNELEQITHLNHRVLVGWSRKSSLGHILKKPIQDRLYGSIAAATIALTKGASIIRTHDIEPLRDAMRLTRAVLQGTYANG